MLNVSGFAESKMMLIMMLAGLGMVVGNLFSGKISGRYSPLLIAAMTDGVIAVTLLLIFAFGEQKVASLALAFLCCAGLFALSAPLQILLLQNAKGGEMLGAAGGQIAFNLGSAIGAFCGGMMIARGLWLEQRGAPRRRAVVSGDERLAHLWLSSAATSLLTTPTHAEGSPEGQHQAVGPGRKRPRTAADPAGPEYLSPAHQAPPDDRRLMRVASPIARRRRRFPPASAAIARRADPLRRHRQQRVDGGLVLRQLRRFAGMHRGAVNTAVDFTGDRGGQLAFGARQSSRGIENALIGQGPLLQHRLVARQQAKVGGVAMAIFGQNRLFFSVEFRQRFIGQPGVPSATRRG